MTRLRAPWTSVHPAKAAWKIIDDVIYLSFGGVWQKTRAPHVSTSIPARASEVLPVLCCHYVNQACSIIEGTYGQSEKEVWKKRLKRKE